MRLSVKVVLKLGLLLTFTLQDRIFDNVNGSTHLLYLQLMEFRDWCWSLNKTNVDCLEDSPS